jgi:hypothetical protein
LFRRNTVKTDQQAKGNQAQALPGASQAQPPADQQTPPGSKGEEQAGGKKEGEKGVKLFTQEEADKYAEDHANKKHGKLRSQNAGMEKWLNLFAIEHPKAQARVQELEDLMNKYEAEGEKKNPDLAEINRMKREIKAKEKELVKREEALRFSMAEHGEGLKKMKAQETKDKAAEIADEFGIPIDDLMDLEPTSEEQMRAFAEKLGAAKKASGSKPGDSGSKAGENSEKNSEDMTMEEYAAYWKKKHPIK